MSRIVGISSESQWLDNDDSSVIELNRLASPFFQLSDFTAYVPVSVPHNKHLTTPKAVTVHLYKNGEEISFLRSNESSVALDVTIYQTISNVEIIVD
jgi:hypothetical protein